MLLKQIIVDVACVGLLVFSFKLLWDMLQDHFMFKRWEQGLQLMGKIADAVINDELTPAEGSHLMSLLNEPSAAALTLVRDRLEEVKA